MTNEERRKHRKKLSTSDKKRMVQELKAKGLTQVEVAAELGCSLRTVKYYWHFVKTGLSDLEIIRLGISMLQK